MTVLRRIATIVAATGALAAIVGWLWNLVAPTPDANIGAGALVVLRLPGAGIGVVLLERAARPPPRARRCF